MQWHEAHLVEHGDDPPGVALGGEDAPYPIHGVGQRLLAHDVKIVPERRDDVVGVRRIRGADGHRIEVPPERAEIGAALHSGGDRRRPCQCGGLGIEDLGDAAAGHAAEVGIVSLPCPAEAEDPDPQAHGCSSRRARTLKAEK